MNLTTGISVEFVSVFGHADSSARWARHIDRGRSISCLGLLLIHHALAHLDDHEYHLGFMITMMDRLV